MLRYANAASITNPLLGSYRGRECVNARTHALFPFAIRIWPHTAFVLNVIKICDPLRLFRKISRGPILRDGGVSKGRRLAPLQPTVHCRPASGARAEVPLSSYLLATRLTRNNQESSTGIAPPLKNLYSTFTQGLTRTQMRGVLRYQRSTARPSAYDMHP